MVAVKIGSLRASAFPVAGTVAVKIGSLLASAFGGPTTNVSVRIGNLRVEAFQPATGGPAVRIGSLLVSSFHAGMNFDGWVCLNGELLPCVEHICIAGIMYPEPA